MVQGQADLLWWVKRGKKPHFSFGFIFNWVASKSTSSSFSTEATFRVWKVSDCLGKKSLRRCCREVGLGLLASVVYSPVYTQTIVLFIWTLGYSRLYLSQEDGQILWKEVILGHWSGISELFIVIGRKSVVGLQSKGNGKSWGTGLGINVKEGYSESNQKGSK